LDRLGNARPKLKMTADFCDSWHLDIYPKRSKIVIPGDQKQIQSDPSRYLKSD